MRGTALWRISTGILGVVIGATGCGAARPQAAGRETAGAALATHQPARKAAAPSATTRLGGVPVGGPAPAGFAATSVTFVSPREAFVLGSAPCARRPCTSIVRTVNRGETWRGLPAPVVPLRWPGASRPAVWGIRFGTPEHGFVFGNGLWETRDGGEHWTRDVWRHGSIISLAVVDRQVLALTDRCARGGCGSNAVCCAGRWRAAGGGSPHMPAHLM